MACEQLKRLIEWARERHMTAVMIPMSDAHGSEYIGDCDRWIYYLSGFSGSAGTLVAFSDGRAFLLTDGRYHIQAAQELDGSGISLIRSGLPGEPDLAGFLKAELKPDDLLGVPSALVSEAGWRRIGGVHLCGIDLEKEADRLWPERPPRKTSFAWLLPESVTGSSLASRLRNARRRISALGGDHLVVSALDAIAWLFDMRGDDIAYTPVLYAWLILGKEDGTLYLQPDSAKTLPPSFEEGLRAHGIRIRVYDEFEADAAKLAGTVILDPEAVSHRIAGFYSSERVVAAKNDSVIPQSVKNEFQIRMMHKAHFLDGLALTKLIYRLKTGDARLATEWDVSAALEEIRSESITYIEPSFETIAAYGSNAAIVHYTPKKDRCSKLERKGFLLLDCGGQYTQGTTDVTRTIALGELSDDEKEYYTAVLKGHLRLAHTAIDFRTPTRKLDELARGPLWELGADYLHGTGHGVGFVLSVHEGPARIIPARNRDLEDVPLLLGHVISDEPGYYREGEFGVRIENLLALRRTAGRRLYLETLTLAPYEREAILKDRLSGEEIVWVDRYHETVRQKLAPHLTESEAAWLAEQTKPL